MVKIIDKSVTGQLVVPGVADAIQLGIGCNNWILFNRSLTASLYARVDGIDPVVGGDGSFFVGPNSSRLFGVPNFAFPEMRVISDMVGDLSPTYIAECNP